MKSVTSSTQFLSRFPCVSKAFTLVIKAVPMANSGQIINN